MHIDTDNRDSGTHIIHTHTHAHIAIRDAVIVDKWSSDHYFCSLSLYGRAIVRCIPQEVSILWHSYGAHSTHTDNATAQRRALTNEIRPRNVGIALNEQFVCDLINSLCAIRWM